LSSSRLISLFSGEPEPKRTPTPFSVSILVHCLAFSGALLTLKLTPAIEQPHPATRYTVRILKLHTTYPQLQAPVTSGAAHSDGKPAVHVAQAGGHPAAPAMLRHPVENKLASLTLLQPDAPPNTQLPLNTPIPLVVLSAPIQTPTPKIVPPMPQKTQANAQPVLKLPNFEARVADLKLSSSASVSDTLPIQPSTTTPIAMRSTAIVKIPQTASSAAAAATPTTVVAISDVVMTQGTVALPLANETASVQLPGPTVVGREKETAKDGSGLDTGKVQGAGSGDSPGKQMASNSGGNGISGEGGQLSGAQSGTSAGDVPGDQPAVTRIVLPEDGSYGVVVVGSSVAREYPESVATWANRLAYTVYLHVGAAKNWILQYALPPVVEAAGRTTRPEAPWPYVIVRPNLASGDVNADAILVHGIVNTNGRFEHLAIAFPLDFPQAKFVLDALQQWQFRPASQDGHLAAVEVLLIIPDTWDQ
jgi:hypothetical protein